MTEQVVDIPVKQPSKSWTQQVVSSLLKRTSAKIGLAWIGLLVLIATFSPFLASSHPLYIVVDGQASSPLLQHMEPLDWVWLSGFFITLVISALSIVAWKKILLWVASIAVVSFIAYSSVTPPVLVVYEHYREMEAAGKVDNIIRAPIPYSAKDYLRDYADTGIESPLSVNERTHWMGTDENGADVASRMIHASRIALGIVDIIGMRLVEIFEAIPTLFLLLSFVAFFGRSIYMMMVIIGITAWSGYARYVRAEFLKLRQQDFVQAAIASGLPLRSILFRHMLPNGLAPLLVATSFGVASAILAEATLSFLGLGLVDDPSWGQLLNQAVQSSTFNWWLAVFPGGAIFMTVFAYNLLGESLRDAVDPHTNRGMQS